jgi:hypothetical protein
MRTSDQPWDEDLQSYGRARLTGSLEVGDFRIRSDYQVLDSDRAWFSIANANPSSERSLRPASAAATAGALFELTSPPVNIVVGVFDLFTYTIAGGLYLVLTGYVAARADLIDPVALSRANGVLLLIGVVVLSYLLGLLAYPLGAMLNRVVPQRQRSSRDEFRRRNPAARDRDFVRADGFLLLAAIQLHALDVATEVNRLRAGGLMARNAAPALALAAVTAIVEAFTSGRPVVAVTCAVVFAGGSLGLILQGRKLAYMASMKTLELCFWLPDIDEKTRSAKP